MFRHRIDIYRCLVFKVEETSNITSKEPAPTQYSVVLVDDEVEFRCWLRRSLEDSPLMAVVGVAADAGDALELVAKLHPQLVVADVHLDGPDGFDLARSIRELDPSVRVLLISARSDLVYFKMAAQEKALFLPKLGLSVDAIVSALEAETEH